MIKRPAGNEVLHGHGVIACAEAMLQIKLMGFFNLDHVELDTEAWPLGYFYVAIDDLQWLLGCLLYTSPSPRDCS